uniref:Uncharacterized protein n=1 Tax=Pristionchus pacificus TaxID=54126 RepID=A0A2A6CH31_PRIPA|eukprot:PDM77535.1 hypothetical protein PRIPAC_34402 [Pristionchus pacificus]
MEWWEYVTCAIMAMFMLCFVGCRCLLMSDLCKPERVQVTASEPTAANGDA